MADNDGFAWPSEALDQRGEEVGDGRRQPAPVAATAGTAQCRNMRTSASGDDDGVLPALGTRPVDGAREPDGQPDEIIGHAASLP